MPEGDTIFRAATALGKALTGARVTQMRSSMLSGPYPLGERILSVEAHGKNLVVRFEKGRALRTHMMMSGSWHLYRDGEKWQRPAWQARLELRADNGFCAVVFNAPVVEWLGAGEAPLARLGPDATSDQFDAAEALSRILALPDRAVGEALLDQGTLSGVGNVIKSEALFRCRQNPFAAISSVSPAALEKLIADCRRLLVRNRTKGPRTARASLDGGRFWVYGRSGKPCLVCGTPVRMRRQGETARSTYFCPACQNV